MNDETDIDKEIIRGLTSGLSGADPAMIETATHRMTVLAFEAGTFSASFFGALLDVMGSSDFAESRDARHILYACSANWDALDASQRTALLATLGDIYPSLSDEMACFVAAELIGKYYCNEDALATLLSVRNRSTPRQRACVPHGLELLAHECADKAVALGAYHELVSMREDPSNLVREEVEQSLRQLARAYPPYPPPQVG